jgi:hypothetical protein
MVMAAWFGKTPLLVVIGDIIDRIVADSPDGRRREILARIDTLIHSDAERRHNMTVLHELTPCLFRGFICVMVDGWLEFVPRPAEELAFPEDLFEACIALSVGVRKMGGAAEYYGDGISLLAGLVFDVMRATRECREGMGAGFSMGYSAFEEMENVLGREIAMVATYAAQDFTKRWLDAHTEMGFGVISALSAALGYASGYRVERRLPEEMACGKEGTVSVS